MPTDLQAAAPVEHIPTDPADEKPQSGVALCLSGGGYRAMLFHLGALWRLNELGQLAKIDRISSVSGGSIVAGALGLAWPKLDFDAAGVARGFDSAVVHPVRRLAGETIDTGAILGGLLTPATVSGRVMDAYRKHLYGSATLQDLPRSP